VPDRICLIVEDDPNIRMYLGLILKERGVQTLEAASAPQALGIVDRLEGRLDLIITDILMPGEMDGLDFAYSVRQRFPGVPIILISGYGEESKTWSSGFPLIAKPFLPEQLWKMVEQVLPPKGEASPSTA
jgi:CheY-like chemotaxis protein